MRKIEPLQDQLIVRGFGERQIAGMKPIDDKDIVEKVNELVQIVIDQQKEILRLNRLNMANHNTVIKFSNPAEHPAVAQMANELHNNYNRFRGDVL